MKLTPRRAKAKKALPATADPHHQPDSLNLTQQITLDFIQDAAEWAQQAKLRGFETLQAREQSTRAVSFKFHRLFTDMKNQHLWALAQLENQYADNRASALQRSVRTKRDERGRKEIERRLVELESKFRTDRAELIRSQRKASKDLNLRSKAEQVIAARQAEDHIRNGETLTDDTIRKLFETAIGKLRKVSRLTKARALWKELEGVCAKFGIRNPVPFPTGLATA